MILLSKHTITNITEPIRLLEYLIKNVDTIQSRNSAKKALKAKCIKLDGETAEGKMFVKNGQVIEHFQVQETVSKVYEKQLDVVFEDEHLAIINKTAGLSVSGNYLRTVQNALPLNLKQSHELDAILPRPVHRLDNQTSGLLLVAKTQTAAIVLGKQFAEKLVTKSYNAIVIGNVEKDLFEIDLSIDNKSAISLVEVLCRSKSYRYGTLTLVKLNPLTGRTHQLRIHMSKIGHPILGDKLYTNEKDLFKGKGLFLSAVGIEFTHPYSKQICSYSINLPHKFMALLEREEYLFQKIYNTDFSDLEK